MEKNNGWQKLTQKFSFWKGIETTNFLQAFGVAFGGRGGGGGGGIESTSTVILSFFVNGAIERGTSWKFRVWRWEMCAVKEESWESFCHLHFGWCYKWEKCTSYS